MRTHNRQCWAAIALRERSQFARLGPVNLLTRPPESFRRGHRPAAVSFRSPLLITPFGSPSVNSVPGWIGTSYQPRTRLSTRAQMRLGRNRCGLPDYHVAHEVEMSRFREISRATTSISWRPSNTCCAMRSSNRSAKVSKVRCQRSDWPESSVKSPVDRLGPQPGKSPKADSDR